ncbi:MAG: ubiquinol-cytochrome c reductase iron-sulfur subunit [Alphaproteobacteria bacterium]|nr:ubiquinol-cytochrome c reductase iron-sulfur subunit [Alphaproteobacteria bacterium]
MSTHDHSSSCCGGGSCDSAAEPNKSSQGCCQNTPAEGECCGGGSRRDFLFMTAGAMAAVGVGSVAWPLVDQMNPAADTLAMSTTEVDLSQLQVGQSMTVMWRGKPVFIRRRTAEEIKEAQDIDVQTLRDKQSDSDRVKKPEWLIVIGVCTHLGCVPLGQKTGDTRGEYDGWFCPCHGSVYDTSGRIRKGPAPKNLEVPQYTFLSDTLVRIG